jgi:hypothetical protein
VYVTGVLEVVYNLRVGEHHTYFVGDETWGWAAWAHNQICGNKRGTESRNKTYTRSFVDVPTITNPANEKLKLERIAREMSPARQGDDATLAYVLVGDSTTPIFASNSDSYPYNWPTVGTGTGQVPLGQGMNSEARKHAEVKAMVHAKQLGIDFTGKSIIVFTDNDPCKYCDLSRGIENAARILGATSVTIWCPSGSIGPISLG